MTARALRITLIASLVVNLFVGGALVAGAIAWHRARVAPAPAATSFQTNRLRRAALALPDEHRRALRRVLRAQDDPALAESAAARADAARLLAAPAYDAPALAAALTRARQADLAIRTGVEQHLVEFAGTLSSDERAALAGAMSQKGFGRRRDRGETPGE